MNPHTRRRVIDTPRESGRGAWGAAARTLRGIGEGFRAAGTLTGDRGLDEIGDELVGAADDVPEVREAVRVEAPKAAARAAHGLIERLFRFTEEG